MSVCPNCKEGVNFKQLNPKTFACGRCGLKLEIAPDWSEILVTLKGKTWRYPRGGYFQRK